ncbi:alpha/beta hydrolase [Flavitalea sp. BT771]|uniref:alpha/beta hydrolase n=1 Tax=Flavitalea sp. BT771 TaxID=3063329 RepID=UPI0026E3EE43|nr:alpha/beta hydrolase [Flavitalea sp. BT771]MDO6430565.1 alpha/beta hydrolase [Flavitalea sp. BT771]MDV6219295.1 alpha/beta hydrolase [Flavitalea sp. BT771]
MRPDEIHITFRDICLTATLKIPHQPRGLVIVAVGKDCPTLKVQNEYLFRMLNRHRFATLFTYLLDSADEQEFDNPFDINRMSESLLKVTKWAFQQPALRALPAGYFAVNVAAAAALKASIKAGSRIKAIVSRCGRPDLIKYELPLVRPALLLITASENVYINEWNKQAYEWLNCEKEIVVLEGAVGSLEAAGKAYKIAHLTTEWFEKHLIMNTLRQGGLVSAGTSINDDL